MSAAPATVAVEPPLALLAELTHRCPLRCPYCSNPLALERASAELDTATWQRVLREAAALGVLQVHFSGGEPLVRRDLASLVGHAAEAGLYGNLITSGIGLDADRITALAAAGLEHVQLSLQDSDPDQGDRVAGLAGAQAHKRRAADLVRKAGLPLTVNTVVHRQNLERLGAIVALALTLGADRLEIAHVQYYGWALRNRRALLPSRAQLDRATAFVEAERARLKGVLAIDYVVPDYYARRPKACMGGWGRRFLNVTPAGKVLPCHAAETLPGLRFPNVLEASLAWIWQADPAFERFRGTAWMPEPCRSCERREIDWGGCRCQAFALTGDAARTDPACALAPDHGLLALARGEAAEAARDFFYRGFTVAPAAPAGEPGG
ncbi:MAG TPA: pyrroloquinoline quinone biosynthesis protein PqqE [Stellaceae bacterium]|jgi:pyrroloquinoline quinone biosynthesis protein E|nr:pyrroloquinoline quinone biosynthesis protein PqqE [Stellaceae bacterium]